MPCFILNEPRNFCEWFWNKNAFQWDAYRPLVARISQHALLPGEGVPAQMCTCPGEGVYLPRGGVPAQGVYLPRGVPAQV